MSQYLSEAFKKLNFLNEDTFTINDNGLEDFVKFTEEDEFEDSIDVIDPEAESEEDLQDSYVGKVILDCCVCHSKIYKDVEDVVIEDDIANANEECPFCYTTDGYKVIGQVAEFDEEESEEETEDKELKESATHCVYFTQDGIDQIEFEGSEDECNRYISDIQAEQDDEFGDEAPERFIKRINEGLFSKKTKERKIIKASELKPGHIIVKTQDGEQDKPMKVKKVGTNGGSVAIDFNGGNMSLHPDEDIEVLSEGIFNFGKKKKQAAEKKRQEQEAQRQADEEEAKRQEKARQQFAADSWARNDKAKRDAEKEYNRNRYNGIKADTPSNTGRRGVNYSGGDYYESIEEGIFDKFKKNKSANGKQTYDVWMIDKGITCILEDDVKKPVADRTVKDYMEDPDYTDAIKNGELKVWAEPHSEEKIDKFLDNSANESLKESVNNVNVETDEDFINVATDDNGKVTVTTEPKTTENTMEDAEVITPIEPEVQSEISDNVEDGAEIEIDMDEFDEESFDELGEGYLKKVYENVNSFKTSNVSFIKNKLVVEGVIKFNSGKSKKTNFIFESREATKSGKVRFIGENKEIARGRKSFTVTGKVDNKKFMSESLNYNYGVKGANGKAQRLYGTVKRGK